MTGWRTLATALADELTAAGKLRSPEWQAAVRAVPRHELAPVHYTMDPHTGDWHAHHTAHDLALAYSNTALFVLPGGLSSTSMPSLMTRMLETLDVQAGHRVLEIGAGNRLGTWCCCDGTVRMPKGDSTPPTAASWAFAATAMPTNNRAGNTSGSPSPLTTNSSGSTPPTATTSGPCADTPDYCVLSPECVNRTRIAGRSGGF